MVLCKRHRSTVKPAVDNFRHSVHFFTTIRAVDRYCVNVWAVQLNIIRAVIGHRFQFFNTSDRMHTSTLTLPDIQRSSPVTVTTDSPVLNVLNPVTETSLTDTLRNPVNCIIICNQVITNCCHLDEPGLTCIINQRSITSPAVRIAMLKLRCIVEKSPCIQIF